MHSNNDLRASNQLSSPYIMHNTPSQRSRVQYASIRFEKKEQAVPGAKTHKVFKSAVSTFDNEDENGYLRLMQ